MDDFRIVWAPRTQVRVEYQNNDNVRHVDTGQLVALASKATTSTSSPAKATASPSSLASKTSSSARRSGRMRIEQRQIERHSPQKLSILHQRLATRTHDHRDLHVLQSHRDLLLAHRDHHGRRHHHHLKYSKKSPKE